jgi:hypothetical protein
MVHEEKNNRAAELRLSSGKKILAGAQDHGKAEKNKSLAAALLAHGKRKPGQQTLANSLHEELEN